MQLSEQGQQGLWNCGDPGIGGGEAASFGDKRTRTSNRYICSQQSGQNVCKVWEWGCVCRWELKYKHQNVTAKWNILQPAFALKRTFCNRPAWECEVLQEG